MVTMPTSRSQTTGSYKPQSDASGVQIWKSVTIDRPREDLYAFWRNFGNFSSFMANVKAVDVKDDKHSFWVVKAPGGTVEWEAVILQDRPEELISWRSTDDAEVDNTGSVIFRETTNGRGTVVTVTLAYDPPAGKLGTWIAKLFGEEPSQQLSQDLRRFKALMETGEVPTNGDLRREVLHREDLQ